MLSLDVPAPQAQEAVPVRPFVPVYQPRFGGREKEYVNQCLDTTWISSKGEFIGRFEAGFADYVGARHALSVCNGTVAIHLALHALGIGPGDEVIVPTLTYVASVNPILQVGAVPVFVDSDKLTWQMDPEDVRRKITPRTRAVLAVHLYGLACDMAALTAICREHGLLLVEDCAEAFGTRFRGRHAGTFGDVATFSFFGNKTITTGEGGMVVTSDDRLRDRLYHLKTQGVSPDREYWHDELAFNYRMTNICAAIGLAQLEQADDILARKRMIAGWYREGLHGLPLVLHDETAGIVHSFWLCTIALDDGDLRRPLRDHLAARRIETRPTFYPCHTLPHYAKPGESHPVAQWLSERGFNLPSYPDLTESQVRTICAEVRGFFGEP